MPSCLSWPHLSPLGFGHPFPQQPPMSSLLPAWFSMVAASEGALSVSPGSAMALESTDRSRRRGCGVSLGGMTDSSESVVLLHGTPQIQGHLCKEQGCTDMRCGPPLTLGSPSGCPQGSADPSEVVEECGKGAPGTIPRSGLRCLWEKGSRAARVTPTSCGHVVLVTQGTIKALMS